MWIAASPINKFARLSPTNILLFPERGGKTNLCSFDVRINGPSRNSLAVFGSLP